METQIKSSIGKAVRHRYFKELLIYVAASLLISGIAAGIVHASGKGLRPIYHVIYYSFIAMVFFLVVNPWSLLYKIKVAGHEKAALTAAAGVIAGVSILCTVPMSVNPIWNGQISDGVRNQYENLADSLLEGHLDVYWEEDTSEISALENPYDMNELGNRGISYHWDHVFYNGHYYVYFGVVPVIVLFIPYKLIFGRPLVTWKATAVFSVFVIIAYFLLGYKMIKKTKSGIPLGVYLVLPSCLSLVTLWYAVKYPALYCTANISGVCFALWAVYFVVDAFYIEEKPANLKIFAGALCGALVFGCRPPIGLCEIILLPFLVHSLKKQLSENVPLKKIMTEAAAFIIPYVVVAVLLMLYNYARFGNPFEFGTRYQLTDVDLNAWYSGGNMKLSLTEWLNSCKYHLLDFSEWKENFPWVTERMGLLVMFPILFVGFFGWGIKKDKCLKWFHALLLLAVGIIIEVQILGAAGALRVRYRNDFSFLLCLAVLFKVIFLYKSEDGGAPDRRKYSLFINYLALSAMAVAFLLFFVSGDWALISIHKELMNKLGNLLVLRDLV